MHPHPSFAARKPFQIPPLKEGRRGADRRTCRDRILRCGARLFSALSRLRGRVGRGRARLSAPHRGFRGSPRLGLSQRFLEPPDANGRTLSGTSAASTSQSGIGPDGLMQKPPARGVYRSAPGNRPRSAFRSTLAKASFVSGMPAMYPYRGRLSHHVSVTGTMPKPSWPGLSRPSRYFWHGAANLIGMPGTRLGTTRELSQKTLRIDIDIKLDASP